MSIDKRKTQIEEIPLRIKESRVEFVESVFIFEFKEGIVLFDKPMRRFGAIELKMSCAVEVAW